MTLRRPSTPPARVVLVEIIKYLRESRDNKRSPRPPRPKHRYQPCTRLRDVGRHLEGEPAAAVC
jgi:hypothetical protein